MSANRASKRQNPQRRLRITERDRAVIGDVAKFGAASRAQLMALGHFTSISRANRRLKKLTEGSYLRRTYIATGPSQNATIYILGAAGAPIAVEDCLFDAVEMKRQGQREPERMYLEHHLGVLSVRFAAERAEGAIQLDRFLSEPECRHEYEVVDRGRKVKRLMKPDALALFARGSEKLPVFIEFDRGNTSLPQMAALFERYGSYWTDTAFQSAYDLDTWFTVAVITTGGLRRIDNLVDLTTRSTVPIKCVPLNVLETEGFPGRIWRSSVEPGLVELWDRGGGP